MKELMKKLNFKFYDLIELGALLFLMIYGLFVKYEFVGTYHIFIDISFKAMRYIVYGLILLEIVLKIFIRQKWYWIAKDILIVFGCIYVLMDICTNYAMKQDLPVLVGVILLLGASAAIGVKILRLETYDDK